MKQILTKLEQLGWEIDVREEGVDFDKYVQTDDNKIVSSLSIYILFEEDTMWMNDSSCDYVEYLFVLSKEEVELFVEFFDKCKELYPRKPLENYGWRLSVEPETGYLDYYMKHDGYSQHIEFDDKYKHVYLSNYRDWYVNGTTEKERWYEQVRLTSDDLRDILAVMNGDV